MSFCITALSKKAIASQINWAYDLSASVSLSIHVGMNDLRKNGTFDSKKIPFGFRFNYISGSSWSIRKLLISLFENGGRLFIN
jgi:hypothetical protein